MSYHVGLRCALLKITLLKQFLFLITLDNSSCALIIYIAILLRENPDHYFFNEEGAHGPIISVKGYEKGDDYGKIVDDDVEFEVSVEGNSLCLVKDFMVAFQIYLESYYIFNLSYPKGLENTLLFFQKYIINICDDGIKISTRVLSLIMKAKNLL